MMTRFDALAIQAYADGELLAEWTIPAADPNGLAPLVMSDNLRSLEDWAAILLAKLSAPERVKLTRGIAQ